MGILSRFSDRELQGTLGIFEDAERDGEKVLRLVQEFRRLYASQKAKGAEAAVDTISEKIQNYTSKHPFTYKGNHTDLSRFWWSKGEPIRISEYAGIDERVAQGVDNTFRLAEQDGLVVINREADTIALTEKGAGYIQGMDFIEDTIIANNKYDELVCKGICSEASADIVNGVEWDKLELDYADLVNDYNDYVTAKSTPEQERGAEYNEEVTKQRLREDVAAMRSRADKLKAEGDEARAAEIEKLKAELDRILAEDGRNRGFDEQVWRGYIDSVKTAKEDARGQLCADGSINYADGVLSTEGEVAEYAAETSQIAAQSATVATEGAEVAVEGVAEGATVAAEASAEVAASATGVGAVAAAVVEAAKAVEAAVEAVDKEVSRLAQL